MNIYFSGISGTALAPLALLASDAGYHVTGSDLKSGATAGKLEQKGIDLHYGPQDGTFLKKQFDEHGIDWFVYTSALPADHPELQLARQLGIKVTKRDALLSQIIQDKHLKLIAVAGTHGKTTTTAMLIWVCHQLAIPVSYSVGSTLPWAENGKFDQNAKYFIYEADEYDHNFLHFHPEISIITSEDFDHPDTYHTRQDYHTAFAQFRAQSQIIIENIPTSPQITLVGEFRRYDASLALEALKHLLYPDNDQAIITALNAFPGAGRRFEKLTTGVYTDYAHHPKEVAATVKMAREFTDKSGFAALTVLYQPHQNIRQHEVFQEYRSAFLGADQILWLPTHLTREDPNLKILKPKDFIAILDNKQNAQPAELNQNLAATLKKLHQKNHLILLMTAGPADQWLREIFGEN